MPRKPKKSILEYYPYETFREGHRELLLSIEKNWKLYDIFIIVAPPAAGKTALRRTIAYWAGDSVMTVPTNALMKQELREYPGTRKIFGRSSYEGDDNAYYQDLDDCSKRGRPILCVPHSVVAKRKSRQGKFVTLNRKVFIADEGHRYVQLNQEMQATHMWRRDFQFPPYVYNRGGLEKFLSLQKSSKKLKTVQDKLVTNNYMVRREKAILRGQWEDRISLVPLSPEPHPSIFRSPEKLIFMSATINELDITDLGISDNRKILKLELPSVIPSSRRPVIPLGVAGVSYSSLRTVAPVLVNYIKEIAEFHGAVKGFVHATYSTAAELRRYLSDDPRYIFHTSIDSKRRFDEWLESEDKIFIASGFEEGIDLKGDEFSWQILTRIPWPSLADPAIRKKVEVLGDSWYYWQTLKAVIQAYGRICRDVNDYGVTYVLDSNWDKLIRESGKYNFLPKFFEEAITD